MNKSSLLVETINLLEVALDKLRTKSHSFNIFYNRI